MSKFTIVGSTTLKKATEPGRQLVQRAQPHRLQEPLGGDQKRRTPASPKARVVNDQPTRQQCVDHARTIDAANTLDV
jgi:hypothetical protein